MKGLFNYDGFFFRACLFVYQMIVLSLLWVVASIPVVTVGASTTALFFAMTTVLKNRDSGVTELAAAFWRSFRQNFKQTTATWLLLIGAGSIAFLNIQNMHLLSNAALAKFLATLQLAILAELAVVTLYVFILFARYNIDVFSALRTAFIFGNRHFPTTLTGFAIVFVIYQLVLWNGALIAVAAGTTAYLLTSLTKTKLERYE